MTSKSVVPQGEWVDLTDDNFNAAFKKHPNDFARAVIAKFKEKNTPPVVPQGEPVGEVLEGGYEVLLYDRLPEKELLYTTPPSSQRADALVEAAIEATKERAAHIVVGWTSCGPTTETDRVLEKIIAAIRSMK